ncbi:hypothetical protein FBU31_007939, partial [Coemansia sp. 'formosensis']
HAAPGSRQGRECDDPRREHHPRGPQRQSSRDGRALLRATHSARGPHRPVADHQPRRQRSRPLANICVDEDRGPGALHAARHANGQI